MNCYIMFNDIWTSVIQSSIDLVPVLCLVFRYNNGADWLVSYWIIQRTCSYVIKQNAAVHQIVRIFGTCVPYCYVTASYKLTFDIACCNIGLLVIQTCYLLTPWCRVLLDKLTGLRLVKFPAFHGTRRFITALTSVRHLSLSWASPIQSIYPHPTSWKIHPNIIHPSMPRSPQWSLFLWFPHQDPIHPPLLTHTCHMPSPSHSPQFYRPHNIGWGVQII